MPKRLAQNVRDNLEKCRLSAISAVEAYNRPGPSFRTAMYLVLIVMAWTALFHAIFYRRGDRPWYRVKRTKAVRYEKIEGEPKHWDLGECIRQYYGSSDSAERKNLEFLLGLRNKVEHRHLPRLDAAPYGECQASLLNLEEMLVREFGVKYALEHQLAVSLQFSKAMPVQKRAAARSLATGAAKGVVEYVEAFRGRLPSTVLSSMKYSFNVFLVPKLSNRQKAADAVVEFVHVDEASQEELERLSKLNVLIREKHIPISGLDLLKPSQILNAVQERVPYCVTMNAHSDAWKHYDVRPTPGTKHPERTKAEYCVYDSPHGDYLYTRAWVERLVADFSDPSTFRDITGREPRPRADS